MDNEDPQTDPPVTRHRMGEVDEDVQMILYWLSRPPAVRQWKSCGRCTTAKTMKRNTDFRDLIRIFNDTGVEAHI